MRKKITESVSECAYRGEERMERRLTKPVGGSGETLSDLTNCSGESFRVDDPGSTVPRDGVEGGPEVEEEHGGDSTGRKVASRDRRNVSSSKVTSNDVHRDCSTERSNEELFAIAGRVVESVSSPRYGSAEREDWKLTIPRRPK